VSKKSLIYKEGMFLIPEMNIMGAERKVQTTIEPAMLSAKTLYFEA